MHEEPGRVPTGLEQVLAGPELVFFTTTRKFYVLFLPVERIFPAQMWGFS